VDEHEGRRSSTTTIGTMPPSSRHSIERLYQSGKTAIQDKNYQIGLTYLQRAYSELGKVFPDLEDRLEQLHEWENMLNWLIVCQCDMGKFDEVQNTLNPLLQAVESMPIATPVSENLMNSICKVCEAAETFITKCNRLGRRSSETAITATRVIQVQQTRRITPVGTQLLLAEIYLRQGYGNDAERQCLEIATARESENRAQIDEETDLLLVLIYYQLGNATEAQCKRAILSDEYKG